MTEHELKTNLEALRPPPASSGAADRALHRATIALRSAASLPPSTARPRRIRLFATLTATLAAACVAMLLALRTAPDAPESSPSEDIRLLTQLGEVFPGRINAVIINEGTAHIELSENAPRIQPSDQALIIELVRDHHRLRVLSYSGRQVSLNVSGTQLDFSPLLTNDNRVLLAGNDFIWSPDSPAKVSGWTINARLLSTL